MANWMRSTLGVLAALALLGSLVAPASAAGDTQVRAVGTAPGPGECTADPTSWFTMNVTGDLVGCWYTPVHEVVHTAPSGAYRERGAELFVGCLADGKTCGTFHTTYQFEAMYDPSGMELRGHCEHPLASGTGGFAGLSGELFIKDDPAAGQYFLRGHIAIP